MKIKKYSAGAVKTSFWFMEFKKAVQLLNSGLSMDEVKELSIKENLFSASTPAREKQIFNTVSSRIDALNPSIYPIFCSSTLEGQKTIALVAAMAHDLLFFEFVYEVIREKMIIGNYELADSDIRVFFKNKQIQSEHAAKWTDETVARLGLSYKTMLYEAGIIDKAKDVRHIIRPIISLDFENWLLNNDMAQYLNALTGVK